MPRFIASSMFALVSALVSLVPAATQGAEPKPPHLALEAYKLPNGLKVALHRDPSVPRVTVCVAFHVGSKNEKAGRTGFAHFFEHMMFRGTKNVPNYDVSLQETGAQSNAFTSEDMTVYFETVASNYLERALYLEAERLAFLPSALDQKKFDTEREVVKNERRQSGETQPYGLDSEAILGQVFPKGHPYSWPVIGSMADLDRGTLDDLKQFFAQNYHTGNATLCLAGDFDIAEAKALIAKYFGPLKPGPTPRSVTVPKAAPRAAKLVQYDTVQFPRVYWNWPTVADDHPDAPALELLSQVLAGGETSRLHKKLILEKEIASEVSADSDTKESAGLFTLQATAVEGEYDKNLPAIETVFQAELDAIKKTAPTQAEVGRALALFEKTTYSALTSPLGRAIVLSMGYAQQNDAAYYKRDFQRYFKVKPADLKRVANLYLKPDKVVVWTVPAGEGHPKSTVEISGPAPSTSPEPKVVSKPPAAGPDWSKMPGPSASKGFQSPKFVKKSLPNGLNVWVAPWKTLPLVSVQLLMNAGTADDPAGKSGLATLTATLLDKGTATKTATELAELAENLGATFSAGAGSDRTSTGFSTISRNLEPSLELLAEMLKSPRFEAKDFAREQELQLTELAAGPDNIGWIARRAFSAILYGADHPYGNPRDGSIETVKALTLDDVKRFHADHLGPKEATLIVVGDVDPEKLLAMIEKQLGGWKPQTNSPAARPESKAQVKPGVIYFVDKPGAVQSSISVGRRWVDRSDARYFATLLGNRILGGDFLSRLNNNLRERNGFTYGASSSFQYRRSGSVWGVGTQVRGDATASALKETIGELDGLSTGKPFTAEEVATAIGAEAKSFPESFESPGSIAAILNEMAEFNLPLDHMETFLGKLQSTGAEAIQKALVEVVKPEDRVILIVGDRKTVEPKLVELGFKTIVPVSVDGKPLVK